MNFFKGNIEKKTRSNSFYRRVLSTTPNMQLVLMSLKPNIEIGMEKHPNTTQFIRVEKGRGMAIISGSKRFLKDGDALMIPPNVYHNIINTGKKPLKLYTLYSPPEHAQQHTEKTKMKNKI